MRSSTVIGLAVLATAAPALAAPYSPSVFARRGATSTVSDEESGAFSLEDGANFASIASSVIGVAEPLVKDVWDHFHKSSRRDDADESGAFSLEDGANLASIASSVFGVAEPLVKDVWDHFHKSKSSRDVATTPDASAADSEAISLKTIASIGSFVAPLFGELIHHFTGNNSRRADEPESGAFSLEDGANLASLASSVVGVAEPLVKDVWDHFHKSKSSRDVAPVTNVTSDADGSEAISLKTIASIASFAAPVIGSIFDHFTHKDNSNQQQRRDELATVLAARAFTEEEASDIFKIGSGVASAVAPLINDVVDHFTQKKGSRSINDLD